MFNNTECLFLLIIGNFENSKIKKIFSNKFKNKLYAKNVKEAKSLLLNNHIDAILCENSDSLKAFSFLEETKNINQNILTFVSQVVLNTDDLLHSIDLKIDAYLLEDNKKEDIEKKLNNAISSYIKNNKIFGQYFDIANESISISKTDLHGIITYANSKFCETSLYKKEELIGQNHNIVRDIHMPKEIFEELWFTIKEKKSTWKGIIRSRKKDGTSFYSKSTIMPILDKNNNILEYISFRVSVSDVINDKKLLEEEINKSKLSVLALINIEEFKILEKFYSSDLIENIERIFGNSLFSNLEDSDTFKKVYFLGNGKYALLCDFNQFMKTNQNLETYFDNYVTNTNDRLLTIDGIEYDLNIVLSYSFGKHMLLEDAKEGLEEAISKNKKVYNSNDASLRGQRLEKNIEIIKMVKIALDNYNIIPYFQPIINNNTKEVEKYESLVRLIDENNNVLSPSEFLDIAKGSHYYSRITHRVLENSFKILSKINTSISINLSLLDIEKENTRNLVYKLLEENKDHAHKVIFELLEDEETSDYKTIKRFIKKVKRFGVKIALDDFGSGYSSFERVLLYEPDIIKIDGSLVKNIVTNESSKNLVETIAIFCKKQGIKTIAEYVENEKIFDVLCDIGIDYSQGYYFGKPQDLLFD